MSKTALISPNAPKPPMNFSHANIANGFVFCAGQGARDKDTGLLVSNDIKEQIEQTLRNIQGILETAGSSMDKVVQTIVYMKHTEHFPYLAEPWQKWFPKDPPVRAALFVSEFGTPGMLIEIVATAVL
jgi:enamine deaminase RidA (YjgF/YER057c/UK114 family)